MAQNAEAAVGDARAQFGDRGMEAARIGDGEHDARPRRRGERALGARHVEGEGLFDQDVPLRRRGALDLRPVPAVRRRKDDGVDRRIGENRVEIVRERNAALGAERLGGGAGAGMAGGEADQRALALHRIDERPTPPADADDRGPDHFVFPLAESPSPHWGPRAISDRAGLGPSPRMRGEGEYGRGGAYNPLFPGRLFLDPAQGEVIAEDAEAGDGALADPRDLRSAAAPRRVRDVDLDRRTAHLGDRRIERRIAGRIARRVEDDGIDAALVRLVYAIDDLAFDVRVKNLDLEAEFGGVAADALVVFRQGHLAEDLGLNLAAHVHAGA